LGQMAMAMARHFSMNNAPHMSGNPLNRLGALELRRLNDATNAALAAIRAAGWAVVPGWQPIETAPKDTVVLLFCPDLDIINRERIELGHAVSTFGRERGWSSHAWATHWMPLPAAPGVKP
jgi:hypothetical protein